MKTKPTSLILQIEQTKLLRLSLRKEATVWVDMGEYGAASSCEMSATNLTHVLSSLRELRRLNKTLNRKQHEG